MRLTTYSFAGLVAAAVLAWSCQSATREAKNSDEPLVKSVAAKDGMVKKGQLLVTIGGCNDCHSPKKFGPHGPSIDSSKLLSGHPAQMPTPPVFASALKPGGWVLMGPDATTFAGPWGVSYAANLTPDTTTGLGSWTDEMFIKAMRTGKHMGIENGRPILPPMPWENLSKLPDEELQAMFAYLKSLPAVTNRVPGPVTPDKVVLAK